MSTTDVAGCVTLTSMTEILDLHARLVVDGADAALAFYTAALGGEVTERYTVDGRVVHAMVRVGPVRFAVKDAGDGDAAPSGGGGPVILSLDVTDADAVAARMLATGATVVFEIGDHGYGDYGGRLADPFGHQWMLSQRIEQLDTDQVQARLNAMHG